MTRLTCYTVSRQRPDIKPGSVERPWMDNTAQSFAYRCLPLNIANGAGWEICCAAGFEAYWTGGKGADAVRVLSKGAAHELPVSHFGSGTLTFHLHGLFRTDPGVALMVTGPFNRPKDGISPLTGVVETDWAPFTFTMNWVFTRRNTVVRFAQGEPFAALMPIELGKLEATRPEFAPIEADPELHQGYKAWCDGRNAFNKALKAREPEAVKQAWQKDYFQGRDAKGQRAPEQHRTKVRLRPFVDANQAAKSGAG